MEGSIEDKIFLKLESKEERNVAHKRKIFYSSKIFNPREKKKDCEQQMHFSWKSERT